MDANTPTQPIPPGQEPQPAYTPQQGYQPQQPQAPQRTQVDEPFYKRYGLVFAITTLVLGAFVILGGVGLGAFAVGNFVSHAGAGISHAFEENRFPGEPSVPGHGNGQGQGNGQGKGQGNGSGSGQGAPGSGTQQSNQLAVVRGTITAIDGSNWTIDTQKGVSVTVQVTSTTDFGTPTRSESASNFSVGQEVIVLGSRSGDTVTAVRVLSLSSFKSPGQSTPGTPSTPSPSK